MRRNHATDTVRLLHEAVRVARDAIARRGMFDRALKCARHIVCFKLPLVPITVRLYVPLFVAVRVRVVLWLVSLPVPVAVSV